MLLSGTQIDGVQLIDNDKRIPTNHTSRRCLRLYDQTSNVSRNIRNIPPKLLSKRSGQQIFERAVDGLNSTKSHPEKQL